MGSKKNDSDKGESNKNNQNKGSSDLMKKQQWRPKQGTSATLPAISEVPKEKEQEICQPPSQEYQESQHKNQSDSGSRTNNGESQESKHKMQTESGSHHIEGIKEIKNKDEVSSMAIVISKNKSETKLLLLQTLHREWVYPKGHIEEGEDSIDCAIRECFEESGVKIERKNYIGKVNEYCYSFNSYDLEITNNMFYELFGAEKIYKTVEVHGFMVESTQPITWNEQERFIGGGWFSLEEAKKMITFDNSQIILQKTIEMLKAYEEK